MNVDWLLNGCFWDGACRFSIYQIVLDCIFLELSRDKKKMSTAYRIVYIKWTSKGY